MLSTAIIIFREVLEIAMILGVVLAATKGLPARMKWIVGGFGAGLFGAGIVALFAGAISNAASGMGQEFFNAMILFTASAVIGWTAVWLRTHGRKMVMHFHSVGKEVVDGKLPGISLSVIIGLAILREGSEIVLFIYGMALSGQNATSIIFGSIIGVVLGTIVGVMLYLGLIKMSAKYMLKFTGWLLMLLVAGLAAQGAGYLSAAGYFSDFSSQLWNTSWLLNEDSIVGKSLHSLIGYTAKPTQIQLTFYLGTLFALISITAIIERNKKHTLAAIAAIALTTCVMITGKPTEALALDEIYSPNAEYKELSVEFSGSRTFDSDQTKNNDMGSEFVIEYGATPRLMVEMSAGFEKAPGETLKLDHIEGEGRYQFFEQGENWLDSGILVAYDHAIHSGDADALEIKLLLQKDVNKFTSTMNVGFDQAVGVNSSGGPDYVLLWNNRYRYNEYFQPGIELQSDFGQGAQLHLWNDEQQYIGPAIWGKLFGKFNYQVAYLEGISKASASSAARVLVEYESHF